MTEVENIYLQQKIHAELVGTYLTQARVGAYCAMWLALYLGVSFYEKTHLLYMIGWVLGMCAIEIYLIYTSLQYRTYFAQKEIQFFKSRQEILHIILGICWGLSFTCLLDDKAPSEDAYRVAVCVAVLIAFSASTMSASIKGLVGYIAPLAALSLAYFLKHFDYFAWWAIGLLGLVCLAIYFGWVVNKMILGQIEGRLLSDHYALESKVLNAKIEQNNFDLLLRNQELLDMQAKLERQAMHDDLTGLYSRRYIIERLNEKLPEAKRHQLHCCLVMMDVDKFKHINDQFGHVAGDDVLRSLAQLLESELRKGDLVARYGGEEFLIMLPMTELSAAQALIERLREQIAQKKYHFDEQVATVTASFGVTTMVMHDNADKMIARADKALFDAKRAGRNCVMTQIAA